MQEPAKSVVLAWHPGMPIPRKADVVLLTEGKSYAAVIDIGASKLESYTELTKDQAPVSETEMHGYDDVLKKEPQVIAALKKRGITDFRLVTCYVTPAGHVGLPEQAEGRRIGWGGCTYSANAKYGWDREIPGIFFVVDMNAKKMVRFSDYGAVPIPPSTSIYDADGGPAMPGTKPFVIAQPDGPSFTINDGEITWQKWHFRFRLDPRIGPVVNLVSYQDGDKKRSVLYEGGLAEMYVPYQDPEETWNSHVFLDAGEYSPIPAQAVLSSRCRLESIARPTLLSSAEPSSTTTAVPIFVRSWPVCLNVLPAIQSGGIGTKTPTPSPAVLRANLCFAPWLPSATTTIFSIGASSRTLRSLLVLAQPAFLKSKQFQTSVLMYLNRLASLAPIRMATRWNSTTGRTRHDGVDHDHYFSYRLDLDVDGVNNSLMVDKLVPYKLPDSAPGRHWIWAMKPEMVKTEGDAKLDVSIQHPAMWMFTNENVKNALGQTTSFAIMPGETGIQPAALQRVASEARRLL